MSTMTRKTLRRSRAMAETYAQMKRDAGHTDVTVKKITPTDWAIIWTLKPSDPRWKT